MAKIQKNLTERPSTEGDRIPKDTYFAKDQYHLVKENRWFSICVILAMGVLFLTFSIFRLIPLEKITPYKVNISETGKVVADFSAFQAYTPAEANIKYELSDFAKKLYTVLGYKSTIANLEEVRGVLVGQAKSEFIQWLNEESVVALMQDNKDLTRSVEVTSTPMLPDDVVLIHVVTTTRKSDEAPPEIKKLLITVKYIISPPKDKAMAEKHPNGLYIQHFTVDNDH